MQIVDNIVIILLIAGAFIAGKKISDSYNERRIDELEYQLRLIAAEKGVGYVAPPPKKRFVLDERFITRLRENGRAVQKFSPNS